MTPRGPAPPGILIRIDLDDAAASLRQSPRRVRAGSGAVAIFDLIEENEFAPRGGASWSCITLVASPSPNARLVFDVPR